MHTTVTTNLNTTSDYPDMKHTELRQGYYICHYADRDHLVLVQGAGNERRAIALDNPEGLYWTTPFILCKVRPVANLSITVS